MPTYGFEVYWNTPLSCYGATGNVCVVSGTQTPLPQYTNAIDCINIGGGDWIARTTKTLCETGTCSVSSYTDENSCVAAGGTWTQPGIWRGPIAYSTTDVTWNQVGFFTVAGGATANYSYPAAAGLTLITQQWMVNDPPDSQEAYAHTVTVTGINVSASGGNQDTIILVLGR